MKNLANITPNDLLTKSDVLRIKKWSYAFFEALQVPAYHIGNRDYFKLIDVDEAIELSKEPSCKKGQNSRQDSNGKRKRRTSSTTSPSKGKGIGAARRQQKLAKQKPSSQNGEARHF